MLFSLFYPSSNRGTFETSFVKNFALHIFTNTNKLSQLIIYFLVKDRIRKDGSKDERRMEVRM